MKRLERIWKTIYVYGKIVLWFFYSTFSYSQDDEDLKEHRRKEGIKKDKDLEKSYRELRNTRFKEME